VRIFADWRRTSPPAENVKQGDNADACGGLLRVDHVKSLPLATDQETLGLQLPSVAADATSASCANKQCLDEVFPQNASSNHHSYMYRNTSTAETEDVNDSKWS
jgi:hypothetical protein